MTLEEAIGSALGGNKVTNEYFDSTQYMVGRDGQLYYEDGAHVPFEFLRTQRFATDGEWRLYDGN